MFACWRAGVLTVCTMVLLTVTGCGGARSRPEGTHDFEQIALSAAPRDVQAYAPEMRAVPGLYVFQEEGQTTLLLQAGKVDQPGELQVIDIRRVGESVRIQAVLAEGGNDLYPMAVIQLRSKADTTFTARISLLSEQVLELKGLPVANK